MKRILGGLVGLLGLLLAGALPASAQTNTQCITNAQAGGTVNAITIPLLPCGTGTNILLLTLNGANTSTTVTLQEAGGPALPVLNATGGALAVGALPAAGAVVELTSTGSSWLLLANGQVSGQIILAGSVSGSTTLEAPPTGGGVTVFPQGNGSLVYEASGTVQYEICTAGPPNCNVLGLPSQNQFSSPATLLSYLNSQGPATPYSQILVTVDPGVYTMNGPLNFWSNPGGNYLRFTANTPTTYTSTGNTAVSCSALVVPMYSCTVPTSTAPTGVVPGVDYVLATCPPGGTLAVPTPCVIGGIYSNDLLGFWPITATSTTAPYSITYTITDFNPNGQPSGDSSISLTDFNTLWSFPSSNGVFQQWNGGIIDLRWLGIVGNPTAGGGAFTGSVAASTSSFTGSIAGTVMTVTAVGSGTIYPGTTISGTNVTSGTQIASQISGTTGGDGTYLVNKSQTVTSTTISGTYGTLTVTSVSTGTIPVGLRLNGNGVVIGTTVEADISGSGGLGTYAVNNNTVVNSTSMYGAASAWVGWSVQDTHIGFNGAPVGIYGFTGDCMQNFYDTNFDTSGAANIIAASGCGGNGFAIGQLSSFQANYAIATGNAADGFLGNLAANLWITNAGTNTSIAAGNGVHGLQLENGATALLNLLSYDNVGCGWVVSNFGSYALNSSVQSGNTGSNCTGGNVSNPDGDTTSIAINGTFSNQSTSNNAYNTGAGYTAATGVGSAIYTTAFGGEALFGSTSALLSGAGNSAFGAFAGAHTQGAAARNSYFGAFSGQQNTIGTDNSCGGYEACEGNGSSTPLTGSGITTWGSETGQKLETGAAHLLLLGSQVASTTLETGTGDILLGTANNCDTAASNTADVFLVCASSGSTPLLQGILTAGSQALALDGATVEGVGTLDIPGAYYSNGTAGVACSGSPTSSFASVGGIVTHC